MFLIGLLSGLVLIIVARWVVLLPAFKKFFGTSSLDSRLQVHENAYVNGNVSNLPQHNFIISNEGKLLEVNELALKIGGVTKNSVLGHYLWDTVWWRGGPTTRETWLSRMKDAKQTDSAVIASDRYYNANGDVRFATTATAAARGVDGNINYYIVESRDETEHYQALKNLKESEDRFTHLADLMPNMVWSADANGVIKYFSRQFHNLVGETPAEKLHEVALNALHPDDVPAAISRWAEAQENKTLFESKVRVKFPNQPEYRWNLTLGLPILDSEGAILEWIGINIDIHNLKRAEERAEAASQAKSEFLANMSHEIRTPLNAIVGLAHILNKPALPPERQSLLISTLNTSAQQLLDLINDLLDVSKLDSAKIELESIPFCPRNLLKEIVDINNVKANDKNILIILDAPGIDAHQHYASDPMRLKQILMNIVGNAVKFTEKGSVTLVAGIDDPMSSQPLLSVDIIDTGIGIKPEHIDSVFMRFSQADSSITRKYGGTGLGLSICKSLVDAFGGTLTVESIIGQGTTFRVRVPLAGIDITQAQEVDAYPEEHMRHKDKGVKVLLVEDSSQNILVTSLLLEDYGYRYDVARTGVEALLKCDSESYSAILMDVQMPEMDGYAATRKIRGNEKARGEKHPTPIIGMTAYTHAHDRKKCLEAGMNEYISKPFNSAELENILMHYIGQ